MLDSAVSPATDCGKAKNSSLVIPAQAGMTEKKLIEEKLSANYSTSTGMTETERRE